MTTPLSKERISELRHEATNPEPRGPWWTTLTYDELRALLDAADENADLRNYRATDAWKAALEKAASIPSPYPLDRIAHAAHERYRDTIRSLKEK